MHARSAARRGSGASLMGETEGIRQIREFDAARARELLPGAKWLYEFLTQFAFTESVADDRVSLTYASEAIQALEEAAK
jgi:hypothetical protein